MDRITRRYLEDLKISERSYSHQDTLRDLTRHLNTSVQLSNPNVFISSFCFSRTRSFLEDVKRSAAKRLWRSRSYTERIEEALSTIIDEAAAEGEISFPLRCWF